MSSARQASNGDIQKVDEAPLAGSLPLLLTVEETALLLRTSRKAIYAMASRGQLPGLIRIGRRVLFRRPDLLRWLEEHRAPSPVEDWR